MVQVCRRLCVIFPCCDAACSMCGEHVSVTVHYDTGIVQEAVGAMCCCEVGFT